MKQSDINNPKSEINIIADCGFEIADLATFTVAKQSEIRNQYNCGFEIADLTTFITSKQFEIIIITDLATQKIKENDKRRTQKKNQAVCFNDY